MASMRDLAIDLINEAKETREAAKKLYILEQVKEIVLRRDISLISSIVPDVFTFMIEKSVPIRKFLIKFASEAMRLNLSSSFPTFLTFMDFFISSEVQENLLQMICYELNSYYVDIVMQVSILPPKSKSSSGPDPVQLWTMLQSSIKFFLQAISSERTDNFRMACLKLSETIILFGLPPPPPITDPRLARAMKSEMSATSNSKNAEDIPLHHPFINRNDLVQEAEDLYSKMLLWSSKNGPQGYPFSTTMVSSLGELIASIAVSRPKKGPDAAKAIISMIQGKSSLCSSMTATEREKLARASHRLIRISVAFVDTDGSIPKLRASIVGLEALGISSAPADVKKRPGGDLDDEEDDPEAKRLRESAIAAVDALETQRKSIQSVSSTTSTDTTQASSAPSTVSAVSSTATETELSSELAIFGQDNTTPLLTIPPMTHTISTNVTFISTNPSEESYRGQSLQSFYRILENYQDIKDLGSKESIIHLQLVIRIALSISTVVSISPETSIRKFVFDVQVPVISTIPYSIAKSHSTFPLNVNLPRAIWLIISFGLTSTAKPKQTTRDEYSDITRERIIYLQALCLTLYNRLLHQSIASEDGTSQFKIYDEVCLVIASRLMQKDLLRHHLEDFLRSLPSIPLIVYELMQILMYSGSKASNSGTREKNAPSKSKGRGTKVEALHVLGQLAIDHVEKRTAVESMTELNEAVSNNVALNYLLWSSVHEDFEIRSKSVSIIVNELSLSEATKELSISFALQSACTLVGVEVVKSLQSRRDYRLFELNQELIEDAEMMETDDAVVEQKNDMEIDNDIPADHVEITSTPQQSAMTRNQYMSIIDAAQSYDEGIYFNGRFDIRIDYQMNNDDSIDDLVAFESYVRRKIQLLLQFCLIEYTLLLAIMDLYAAAVIAKAIDSNNPSLSSETSQSKLNLFQKVLVDELSNIIPAISKQHRPEVTFYYLMAIDPLAYPLLEVIVQLLLSDVHVPATPAFIAYADLFLKKMFNDQLTEEKALLFSIPMLGGYSMERLQSETLPNLVKVFSDKTEILRQAFQRIVLVRPPPISKVGFLVLLHRMNFESYGIKQKVYLESINACLSDISTFTGDVIRDAIAQMVDDEVLPVALVRTALLASKAHNDVRKYVLSELIPYLVRKQIWNTAPVHWEGIKHCIKTYAIAQSNQNIVEPTLRAILGLPGAQIKAVITVVPTIKASLSKLLKVLSMEEKEEVLSGRWAGIQSAESESLESEKAKIIKELMTS